VREQRAKVFKLEKVTELVEYLEREIAKATGVKLCSLLADLAIVHCLWETWSRGKECGELESRQIDSEHGIVKPGWTKTQRIEPSAKIAVKKGIGFIQASNRLIISMEHMGYPIGNGFLFRPLNRGRNGFEETPLMSVAMRRRIQKHLKAAGLYEGETLHSFRRSAVQYAADIKGYDIKRLMELGRWQSYSAF
jgi:integrase